MASVIDVLQQPAGLIPATFVFGLLVGSFLNVVILRLPVMLERAWREQAREVLGEAAETTGGRFDLITPGSHCPACGRHIRAWENIPVLSWLAQHGRCRGCRAAISARYPTVELLAGLLSAAVAWHFGWSIELAGALLLTWSLIALSGIDVDHQLLPDTLTLPMLWFGLAFALLTDGALASPVDALIGAMAGYLSLWLVFHCFRLATGKEGMGYGDFKLLALLGAWLGWQALPVVILMASLVGAVAGVAMVLVLGRDRELPIPFGPYLAAAGWLTLLWRDDLIAMYMRLSGLG
ncbi:A24 family peptidase [Aquisalimonas sp.]|uniref:prepilin peptidase n=1 Tax=Aquisalimonas sp. TaxID=1872621 RepID=UPI0025C0CC0B|nr:A24 family peptidase [Aquisalimonas sp.]